MNTQKTTTTKIKFDDLHFSCLKMFKWNPGYSNVGLQFLKSEIYNYDDSKYLTMFLDYCGDFDNPNNDNPLNEDNVLSVKATDSGAFDKVYGPIVLSSEDEQSLVLRCGANIFPVTQEKGKFYLGSLVGDIETSELEITDKVSQKKVMISIPRIDFKLLTDKSIIYQINLFTKPDIDGEIIKDKGRDGESIAEFLRPMKSGGGNIVKMKEMPSGEYEVINIDKELKTNEKGAWASYTLHLKNGISCWVNENLRSLLDSKYDVYKKIIAAGTSVTLVIEKTAKKNAPGEFYVNASLPVKEPLRLPQSVAVKSLTSANVIDVKVGENGDPIPF
jgi:hypothetical protein